MDKFIKNISLYAVLLVAVTELIFFALIKSGVLYQLDYPGREIYWAIEKSKQKSTAKKLLLGDSVGFQLLPNSISNDSFNSLTSNQSISMAGQYFFLNNYLRAGNKPEIVIIFFHPFSFQNNLNQLYTYHYFVKPFYNSAYRAEFTPKLEEQIGKIPSVALKDIPHISGTSWAPDFEPSKGEYFTVISPISREYLSKIKQLSQRHKFTVQFLSVPVSKEFKKQLSEIDRREFVGTGYTNELEKLMDNVEYLDDTEFSDGIHLRTTAGYSQHYKKLIMAESL